MGLGFYFKNSDSNAGAPEEPQETSDSIKLKDESEDEPEDDASNEVVKSTLGNQKSTDFLSKDDLDPYKDNLEVNKNYQEDFFSQISEAFNQAIPLNRNEENEYDSYSRWGAYNTPDQINIGLNNKFQIPEKEKVAKSKASNKEDESQKQNTSSSQIISLTPNKEFKNKNIAHSKSRASSKSNSHTQSQKVSASTVSAFAALRQDGTVVTWGDPSAGGDSSEVQDDLRDVVSVSASNAAFAALRQDGTVVTWGDPGAGGDSSEVQSDLYNVVEISSSFGAFAALREDGSVVTWGETSSGGDNTKIKSH